MKKIVLLAFVLVLLSTAVVVGFVRPVVAQRTIYIRPDGSVDPPTPSIQRDGDIYTFTDNIYDSIVVERSNIIVDGNGYTLQGSGSGTGFNLTGIGNVTIKSTNIKKFGVGIHLNSSNNIIIYGNNVTWNDLGIYLGYSSNSSVYDNDVDGVWGAADQGIYIYNSSNIIISRNNIENHPWGILLMKSSCNTLSLNNIIARAKIIPSVSYGIVIGSSCHNTVSGNNIRNVYQSTEWGAYVYRYSIVVGSSYHNTVSGNNITSNDEGIKLSSSSHNTISRNNITKSLYYGIKLLSSSNNKIYHNALIKTEVSIEGESTNIWDDGYPSGGNYWTDYVGVDELSGPNQDEPGSDGIVDKPHIVDANNTDNYPLMGMFSDFSATLEYHVQTICNSSISSFQFNGTAICFNITGEDETTGFCRICIPAALMNDTYKVFVNGTEVPHTRLPCSNSTHSYLYFTYNHSTQEVIVIPEFPTWMLMLLILIVLTVAIVIYKRRLLKTPIH